MLVWYTDIERNSKAVDQRQQSSILYGCKKIANSRLACIYHNFVHTPWFCVKETAEIFESV